MYDSEYPVDSRSNESAAPRYARTAIQTSSAVRGREVVVPHSIADLVALLAGERGDPWQLSLVQRDAVWDDLQVRYLLDSILRGYPIGSLLLCQVHKGGSVLRSEGGRRVRKAAGRNVPQLLDGQQRMNALAALFGADRKASRRYLIKLDAPEATHDIAKTKSSLKRGLSYIRDHHDEETRKERWRWMDVSRLHSAAKTSRFSKLGALSTMGSDELIRLASQIDPECSREAWRAAPDHEMARAAVRIRELITAWHSRSVPVITLRLKSPTDVLQVFNRVNRTGTKVAGDDIFFAAVRTLWPVAEEYVEQVCQATSLEEKAGGAGLLPRIDALRLLARVASLQLNRGDLLPLDVEQLRGDKGEPLVIKMEKLCDDGRSPFLSRLRVICRRLVEDSGLGYGLREIPKRLLDPVLAWAVARETSTEADLEPAVAFLVGATAFRYTLIFGHTFEHVAMEMAATAGAANNEFPLTEILKECLHRWPRLERGRRSVSRLNDDDNGQAKRDFVNDNAGLFLHLVQEVPFDVPPGREVQVEHLFPQARLDRNMRWKGENGNVRLQRHSLAKNVGRAGNLFILDGPLNREGADKWPDVKLRDVYRGKLWPEKLFLGDERKSLELACEELRKQKQGVPLEECIPKGMEHFEAYVRLREERILELIESRFPRALGFGGPERLASK